MNGRDASRLYFATRALDRRLRAVEQALGLPSPEHLVSSSSSKIAPSGQRAEMPTEMPHDHDDPDAA
jgi:hypothetical protein